jgi:ribokinase
MGQAAASGVGAPHGAAAGEAPLAQGGVVVVGSCNADLVSYVDKFPAPGETLTARETLVAVGGKGCNQAFMAARLAKSDKVGAPPMVAMLGCVGADVYGARVREQLASQGVCVSTLLSSSVVGTGTATITVDARAENTIVLFPGANGLVAEADVDREEWLFERAAVVVAQNEIPIMTTLHALKAAKSHHRITVFNPAPVTPELVGLPQALFKFCDILVVNEGEAAALLGRPAMLFDGDAAFESACRELQALIHGMAVILTAGARGVVVVSTWNDQATWARPPSVKAVDTSGAGDCFVGAFAYALAREVKDADQIVSDASLLTAVRIGTAAAALSVQRKGAQLSYPDRKDVFDLYAKRMWSS